MTSTRGTAARPAPPLPPNDVQRAALRDVLSSLVQRGDLLPHTALLPGLTGYHRQFVASAHHVVHWGHGGGHQPRQPRPSLIRPPVNRSYEISPGCTGRSRAAPSPRAARKVAKNPHLLHMGRTSIFWMRFTVTSAIGVLAVAVGIVVGFCAAQLRSYSPLCPPFQSCPSHFVGTDSLTFTGWQCALFGAGAAAVLLVVSLALARLRPQG